MPELTPNEIADELRRRGLLATAGMHRLVPMTGETETGGTTANSPTLGGGATPNLDGTVNVTDLQGNPIAVNPNNLTPETTSNISDDGLNMLWPFLAGAGGAAMGYAAAELLRRGKKPPTDIPVVEGEVIDPLAPLEGPIPEGEFSEVGDTLTGRAANDKGLPTPQKQLTGPTAQEIRNRKAANVKTAPSEQSVVKLADEFSDLTPEELARARLLAEQLVMQRQRGNVRSYKPGVKGVGPQHLPTSRGRATDKVDDMLGNVVRMIREGKVKPNQVRRLIP